MFFEERNDAVLQQIRSNKGIFPVIELGHCHRGVGIDEGLLVDLADILQIAHIEGILGAQVTRMLGFDLSVSFLLVLCLFQRFELVFREDDVVLDDLRLEGLEALFEGLEVMALPDTPDTGRRDKDALAPQFIGNTKLSPDRFLNSHQTYPVLYLHGYSVLGAGFSSGELLQGQLSAPVIKFFEPVGAVP